MDTQPTQQFKKVSFTPFLSQTYDYEQFKRAIIYDIDEIDTAAADLPLHIKILFSQVANLFNPFENQIIQDLVERVTSASNAFIGLEDEADNSLYAHYRSKLIELGTEFLTRFGSLELRYGLSYSLEKDKASTPFDLLKSVLDIPGYRMNSFGFPVSFQQRVLAEFALERVQANYDLTMLVVGKRGRGKSTFTFEEVSTFLESEGRDFGLENIVLTESRDKVFEAVKKWQPGEGHIFDEAINQLFSRDFFKGQDFISLLTEIRYKKTFTVFTIPELFQIDKIVRESLVDVVVQITERGIGVLSAPSLLSGEQRYMEKKPTTPVLTPQAHTDYLIQNNLNSILLTPFWEIPASNQIWKAYESVKDTKIGAKKFMRPQGFAKQMRAANYYYQFLVMLANTIPNANGISEKQIVDYGVQQSYKLSAQGLASWLSKNIGIARNDLIIDTPNGIIVDISSPFVKSYLMKLKSINAEIK